MKSVSHRHHYIPEFYLKNFTNPEGKFHIYLVKEKRFVRDGKLFYPSEYFFTTDGNTIDLPPAKPDYLEDVPYRDLDNEIAPLVKRIKEGGSIGKDWVKLQYFFSHLFWRNPANDEYARHLLESKSFEEIGLLLPDTGPNNEIKELFEKYLKFNKDYFKAVKWELPTILFPKMSEIDRGVHIHGFPNNPNSVFLGDNPVILKRKEIKDDYSEEMIVPITKDHFFVRSTTGKCFINSQIKEFIDLIQLKQASKFVCVTDMSYIRKLENIFDKINDENYLRKTLFAWVQGLDRRY